MRGTHTMLARQLRTREEPIRVGAIGAGIFGSQVIHAVESTPGMETVAIADLDLEKARTTFRRTGVAKEKITTGTTSDDLAEAIGSGTRLVTQSSDAVTEGPVDVVVEATGDANVAARNCLTAIMAGTHVVNVSVEADAVCGHVLARLADRAGVSYSLAFGDQPGRTVDLCDWAETTGFEIVAAGKSAREPQPYGTPDDALDRHPFIDSLGGGIDPDPTMYNSFMDGTKTAVEAVSTANALGLTVDRMDMHQPTVPIEEIPETLRPARGSEDGVLSQHGVVDVVTPTDGSFSVFVVTRTESTQLQDYFSLRPNVVTSDDGEYQLFTQPFHFAPETTVSIAHVALQGTPTGSPVAHETEVVAAAKRDLGPGETLDGGGGYTIYGVATNADRAIDRGQVPFGLLSGATVTSSVDRDEIVTWDEIEVDREQPLLHVRELQDALSWE